MCGIVGLIARKKMGLTHNMLQAFESMLIVDTLRGKDSVGAFTRYGNGDFEFIKHGSNPFNLFRTDSWKEFRQKAINRGKFIIGHNRAATMGEVNTDNAHPFLRDHIVMVHNGTLRGQLNLTREQTKVDSEAIVIALAEEQEDPRRVLDKINGAFALVWYDAKVNRLFMARNSERPLNLIETEDAWVVASEPWIGTFPVMKHNIDVKQVIPIPENVLFEFKELGEYRELPFNAGSNTWDQDDWDKRWEGYTGSQRRGYIQQQQKKEKETPFVMGEAKPNDPPQIRNLRARLLEKHNDAKATMQEEMKQLAGTCSTDCALTQPSGTGTAGHTTAKGISDEEELSSRMGHLIKDIPEIGRGEQLTFKILQTYNQPNGRIRFNGVANTPGVEMYDVTGYLPVETHPGEIAQWLGKHCRGKVHFSTYTHNGGHSICVKEVKKCTLWPIHREMIPIAWWDFAMLHDKCSCGSSVHHWQNRFTHVKFAGAMGVTKSGKPLGQLRITCPECIIKKTGEGEFRNDFEKAYRLAEAKAKDAAGDPAVQGGEQLSEEPVRSNVPAIIVPGSTTVQ